MTRVRSLASLWVASVGMSALILAPLVPILFGSGDAVLYRDAVATPRSFVTDTALGLGGSPARAVPQDWAVAVASSIVDGSVVIVALTFAALVLAGVGFGMLAGRVVPAARTPGMLAAAVVAIWNPFVAERLLQGQWSLLIGYGALGFVIAAASRCRTDPTWSSWSALAAWSAVAGLTPTGSLFAAIMIVAVLVVPLIVDATTALRTRLIGLASAVVVIVVASLPWLVASLLSSAPATSDRGAVDAFAARAEPGLGTLGSLVGLGGIWNADAVPSSRHGVWAVVATACLLLVVGAGVPLMRRRRRRISLLRSVFWVAAATLVLVALAATGPGRDAMGWFVDTVPGAGLFRDTQKWVALAVPFYAVAAAYAVQTVGRWVPRGLAATVAVGLIAVPLPDLAWGVGDHIAPITYPADWARVAATVTAGSGDVAVLPDGSNRRYGFTDNAVSLDPAARMLRAPVLATGELTVGGRTIDRVDDSRAAQVQDILAHADDPRLLAQRGVGWLLVEGAQGSATLDGVSPVFRGPLLTLYRIPRPTVVEASHTDRVLAWTAHGVWLGVIVLGALAATVAALRRWTPSHRRTRAVTTRRPRRPAPP